jgi:glycerol uptake facilitator-like aquaporin
MLVAEFFGTAVLTLSVLAVMRSQIGIGYFVAIAVGLTLSLLVLTIGSTSGAHVNPAVTIGMWTVRKIATMQAVAYIAAQMLGGLAAWRLYEYLVNRTLPNIAEKTFDWRVLVAEVVGTFVLTFGIAAAVYQGQKGLRQATTVGGSLFLGILIATVASNGILNPAVALGVQSWSRAYVFGPIIGAIIGFNLYALLFAPAGALSLRSAKATSAGSTVSKVSRSEAAEKPAAKKPARKSTRKTAKKK